MHININKNYSEYNNNIETGYYSGSGSGSGSELDSNFDYSQDSYTTTNFRKGIILYIFIAFVICFCILIIPYIHDSCRIFKYNFDKKYKNIKKITNIKCIHCKLKYINYKNKNKINPDDNNIDCDTCTICLTNNDKNSIKLLCNHSFHNDCINEWIQTSIDSGNTIQCPLCRVSI